jgi:hypothetical protein
VVAQGDDAGVVDAVAADAFVGRLDPGRGHLSLAHPLPHRLRRLHPEQLRTFVIAAHSDS